MSLIPPAEPMIGKLSRCAFNCQYINYVYIYVPQQGHVSGRRMPPMTSIVLPSFFSAASGPRTGCPQRLPGIAEVDIAPHTRLPRNGMGPIRTIKSDRMRHNWSRRTRSPFPVFQSSRNGPVAVSAASATPLPSNNSEKLWRLELGASKNFQFRKSPLRRPPGCRRTAGGQFRLGHRPAKQDLPYFQCVIF